jgi:capsular polysaccharide biosynthesis protein|tara:strand:- start:664 stop:810 length:147 start_codon:yes stop_codon:yes gene_type:complete
MEIMTIVIAVIALLFGSGISYFVFNNMTQNKGDLIINEAKKEVVTDDW